MRTHISLAMAVLVISSVTGGGNPLAISKPLDGATWALDSWREWPFDSQQVTQRTVPLVTEDSEDWVRTGDSWVTTQNQTGDQQDFGQSPEHPFGYSELDVVEFYITGGGNKEGPNRIFCASAVPKDVKKTLPVLFVFHGGGGHASWELAASVARNNPGFAIVAVDYNGQFRPTNATVTQWVTVTEQLLEPKHDLVPNPMNFPMFHYTQAARRVLDWTETQSWADPSRFGAVGISYGGWVAFFIGGVDERIKSIYTYVSSGGTDGMRGRSSMAHDWLPADQVEIWKRFADPIQYAHSTQARVFLNISSNDRFFWLDGADRHRDLFPGKAQWLITPNKDHGNGGPELSNPIGNWHQSIYLGGIGFPTFGEVSIFKDSDRQVSVQISSEQSLESVLLAWSPGNAVSPARYWRLLECQKGKKSGWFADIPSKFGGIEGYAFFIAIDKDGRAASSDLVQVPGIPIRSAITWDKACLWDRENGADAWRTDLSYDVCQLLTTADQRVLVLPKSGSSKATIFTNSTLIPNGTANEYKGIRFQLDGNGVVSNARILLAHDLTSLDQQRYAAEVEIGPEITDYELTWDQFILKGSNSNESCPLPANALGVEIDNMPVEGITIGMATLIPLQPES